MKDTTMESRVSALEKLMIAQSELLKVIAKRLDTPKAEVIPEVKASPKAEVKASPKAGKAVRVPSPEKQWSAIVEASKAGKIYLPYAMHKAAKAGQAFDSTYTEAIYKIYISKIVNA
jgi:hypothetical protein